MKKIRIISDGNELEYKETKLVNKVPMLCYEYVVSKSKKGEMLMITQVELDKMVRQNIAKQLK